MRGRGNDLPGAPSIVKADGPASYPIPEGADFANVRTLKGGSVGSTGRAEASSEAAGKVASGAGELGDRASLDLSDDVELDAFVDTVMDEMDGKMVSTTESSRSVVLVRLIPIMCEIPVVLS